MRISSVLPIFMLVSIFLIGFSSAAECRNSNGTLIDKSLVYCDGDFLITDTCVSSSAFSENKISCQYGCDSVNKACRTDPFGGIEAIKPEGAINQEIKCLFRDSNMPQECSTSSGSFSCTGTDSCLLRTYGFPGQNITLVGSCEGNPKITVDGVPKVVNLDCKSQLRGVENVTCIFKNSDKVEKCYSDEFSCSGVGSCKVQVSGQVGKKFIWKSTCGGEDNTVVDLGNQKGGNDYALFYCGFNEPPIPGYRQAYTLCYDGYDIYKGTYEDCKTEEAWKLAMDAICDGRCRGENECGSKRFKAFTPCGNITFIRPAEGTVNITQTDVCNGCKNKGTCQAIGFRGKNSYCSYTGDILNYSKMGENCENNYQCEGNNCISGACGPHGFFEKISSWFKNLFKK